MTKRLVLIAMLAAAALPGRAQNQSIPGLIAVRETAALSYEDRLAAYDAEQAALAKGGLVTGFDWKGPKGAYGTIIVGGIVPQAGTFNHCRRFIHIVHHKNDRGANPTFQGTICRDGDGKWMTKEEPQKRGAILLNPVLIEAGGTKLPDVDRWLALETEERVLVARFPGGEGYNWYGPSGAKGNVRTVYINGESDDCRTLRHQIAHADGQVVVAQGQLCLVQDGKWVAK